MVNEKWIIKDQARSGTELPSGGSEQSSVISIRQIVVPVDLTADERKAIGYAVAIARCFNAKVTLIHIYDPAYVYAGAEEVAMRMERLCSELRREHPALDFILAVGAPYLQIPAIASKVNADLMVISTEKYSWLERFICGSDAEQIVRRSSCPILVVARDDTSDKK